MHWLPKSDENMASRLAPRTRAAILSVIIFAISPPGNDERLWPTPFPDDFARSGKWFRKGFAGGRGADERGRLGKEKAKAPPWGKRGFLGWGSEDLGKSSIIGRPGSEKVQDKHRRAQL